jgi:hypothetical protein
MLLLRVTTLSLFCLQSVVVAFPQSQPETSAETITDSKCQKLKELSDGGSKLTDSQLGDYSKCLLEHRVKSDAQPTYVPVIGQFQLNTKIEPLGVSKEKEGEFVK